MTKTGLENLNRKSREEVASKDRTSREDIAHKDRKSREEIAKKDRVAKYITGGMGLAGSIARAVNDPEYYKRYLKNLDDFVNVPTIDRLGSPFTDGWCFSYNGTPHAIGGIMLFDWYPSIGNTTMINSGLSRLKELILASNSRSDVPWEFSDLGYNIMCTADIMSAILSLGRVIKVYKTYRSTNAYLAQTLITALGWSYSDIVAHYATYRKVYSLLATKFNKAIVAPAEISLYARRAFLAENIFIDSHDDKYPRQMYAYKQKGYLVLSNDGTECNLYDIGGDEPLDIVTFESLVDLWIRRITENPDFGAMYQDLRHAFGSKLIQLPEHIEEGTEITFNSVDMNRLQIHNLKSLPLELYGTSETELQLYATGAFDVTQDSNGYLRQGAYVTSISSWAPRPMKATYVSAYSRSVMEGLIKDNLETSNGSGFIVHNSFNESVSGDEILDITRWDYHMSIITGGSGTLLEVSIPDSGTEICMGCRIVVLAASNPYTYRFSTYTVVQAGSFTSVAKALFTEALVTNFDWAPIIQAIWHDGSSAAVYASMIDAHTTYRISVRDVNRISEACILSEFYVPDAGFYR